MRPRTGTVLAAAQTIVLLVPATLLIAFLVFVSYPTLPAPTPWQAAFDVAVVAVVLGLVCTWRLTALRLRHGRYALPLAQPAWYIGAALGGLVGIFAAAVAVEHLLNPDTATELVGFAMLAPAAAFATLVAQLAWECKKAVPGRPDTAPNAALR
jgi:hypothetical protein